MIPTQHSLVIRIQGGGSDDDWGRFYSLYERPILAFASSHSLSEAECADVLQETMIKMLRVGFARFDPTKGRFTGFLFHVARCCVVDAVRRRGRREGRHVSINGTGELGGGGELELVDGCDDPADLAERAGEMALIFRSLDLLIEKQCFRPRTVSLFKAVTIEQRDPQEVAEEFETSVGNVYEAKRAVLARLRRMLQALDRGADLEEALAA